jgi:hypothetical protein
MKCDEVRMLLAAYRRGEWTFVEQRQIAAHLSDCSACRRWEKEARQVGEMLRDLPIITPPADFRDRVFAAIKTDQELIAVAARNHTPTPDQTFINTGKMAQVIRSATSSVERVGEVALASVRPRHVFFGKNTAIATVAALFAIVFLAQLIPFDMPTKSHGDDASACLLSPCRLFPASVKADPLYPTIISSVANHKQAIFVAQSPAGQYMVFIWDQQDSGVPTKLLAEPSDEPIKLIGLSSSMLVWSKGTTNWIIYATPLVDHLVKSFEPSKALPILSSDKEIGGYHVSSLADDIWIDGKTALLDIVTSENTNILVRATIAEDVSEVYYALIEQASPGHVIADPYLDGQVAYWIEKVPITQDMSSDVIKRQSPQQEPTVLFAGKNLFDVVANKDIIAYFQENTSNDINSKDDSSKGSGTVFTILQTQDSSSTVPHARTNNTIDGKTIHRGPSYIAWRDKNVTIYSFGGQDNGTHTYTLIPPENTSFNTLPESLVWTISQGGTMMLKILDIN